MSCQKELQNSTKDFEKKLKKFLTNRKRHDKISELLLDRNTENLDN